MWSGKKLFSLSTAALTVSFADCIGLVIAVFMLFHIVVTVDFKALNAFVTVVFRLLTAVVTCVLMLFQVVTIAVFICIAFAFIVSQFL